MNRCPLSGDRTQLSVPDRSSFGKPRRCDRVGTTRGGIPGPVGLTGTGSCPCQRTRARGSHADDRQRDRFGPSTHSRTGVPRRRSSARPIRTVNALAHGSSRSWAWRADLRSAVEDENGTGTSRRTGTRIRRNAPPSRSANGSRTGYFGPNPPRPIFATPDRSAGRQVRGDIASPATRRCPGGRTTWFGIGACTGSLRGAAAYLRPSCNCSCR